MPDRLKKEKSVRKRVERKEEKDSADGGLATGLRWYGNTEKRE